MRMSPNQKPKGINRKHTKFHKVWKIETYSYINGMIWKILFGKLGVGLMTDNPSVLGLFQWDSGSMLNRLSTCSLKLKNKIPSKLKLYLLQSLKITQFFLFFCLSVQKFGFCPRKQNTLQLITKKSAQDLHSWTKMTFRLMKNNQNCLWFLKPRILVRML